VELRTTLGNDVVEVSHARHLFAAQLMLWGVASADVAVLLVSELVTNALLHGAPPVELRARLTPKGLRVEVSDSAPAQPVVRDTPLDTPGGQGLRLVDALASRWGWTPATVGKAVWFEIDAARSGLVTDALAAHTLAGEAIPRLMSRGRGPASGTTQ
jgi:anti-sigma regulatory factor (Ser/Thr protein kinase)